MAALAAAAVSETSAAMMAAAAAWPAPGTSWSTAMVTTAPTAITVLLTASA
jgi:hypothetical protein